MLQELLKKYQVRAKKSLGQNFLVDEIILQKIADCTEIMGKNIVEVGPGYGALTEKILEKKPKSLHLVELDRDMVEILHERFIDQSHLKIFHQDVLTFFPDFGGKNYIVVANIPYYITSPILTHFLYTLKNPPREMLILLQKDVGDKILMGTRKPLSQLSPKGRDETLPKKHRSSVLSLMIAKKCFVSEKLLVPACSFIPVPKVESSVLYFETHEIYTSINDEDFLRFIKIGFAEPRKKLIKNLVKGGYDSEKILDFFCRQGVSEAMRGEQGDIDFWIQLYTFLK